MNDTKFETMYGKGVFIRYTIVADAFVPLSKLRKRHREKSKYGKRNAEKLAKKEIEEMESISRDCDEQEICLYGRRILVKKVTGHVTDGILPRDS